MAFKFNGSLIAKYAGAAFENFLGRPPIFCSIASRTLTTISKVQQGHTNNIVNKIQHSPTTNLISAVHKRLYDGGKFGLLLGRPAIACPLTTQFRHLTVSTVDSTRTQWSYTRPRGGLPNMHLPKRLLDGKYWRCRRKGGRDYTGKIVIRHKGGGHARNLRIVTTCRLPLVAEGEEPVEITERVVSVGYDPFRSGRIMLVAGDFSNQTRLLLAPHEIEVGDHFKSSRGPPEFVARMKTGDAYPLEFIPTGIKIHSVERSPGDEKCPHLVAGGMFGTIQKKTDDEVVIKPCGLKKEPIVVDKRCMAVIGMVSNPGHAKLPIGKAGRNRWLNQRPRGATGYRRWHHWKKKTKGGSPKNR